MALDFNPQGCIMPAEGSGVKEEQDELHEISCLAVWNESTGARGGCSIGLSISGCSQIKQAQIWDAGRLNEHKYELWKKLSLLSYRYPKEEK